MPTKNFESNGDAAPNREVRGIEMLYYASLVVEEQTTIQNALKRLSSVEEKEEQTKAAKTPLSRKGLRKSSLRYVLALNNNKLVEKFSTNLSNELTGHIVYGCQFGENCGFRATMYKNQAKAKKLMGEHLASHINTLKKVYPEDQQDMVIVLPKRAPFVDSKQGGLRQISENRPVTMDISPIIKEEPQQREAPGPIRSSRFRDRRYGLSEDERDTALAILRNFETGDRKGLECRICGQRFTATSSLVTHYKSHAGIKEFQCDQCPSSFSRLHSLNYHKMTHLKQVRFICPYCSSGFRHPSHYKEHLRKHTGEEPFKCPECGFGFKTRNTYKRHLMTKHALRLTRGNHVESVLDNNNNNNNNNDGPHFAPVKLEPMEFLDYQQLLEAVGQENPSNSD